MPLRQSCLDRLFVYDGIECSVVTCSVCPCSLDVSAAKSVRRCIDCFQCPIFCLSCLLKQHSSHPFHRVQVSLSKTVLNLLLTSFPQTWTGSHWVRDSLGTNKGFFVYLGHNGKACSHPSWTEQMTILHTNSIHRLTFVF